MLLFSDRVALEEMFRYYATKTNIKDCPVNLIAFLMSYGIINESKAKDLAREWKRKQKED